jgi:CRISPR-associated protein Cas2
MEGYGNRVQYSVFICDLSDRELYLMRSDLESCINHREDSVMIIDLGAAGDSSRFSSWVTMRNCQHLQR